MVREELSFLFEESYPLTLNHGDFSGLKIFINPSTGHITGIIDWSKATISPFGISLWSLENLLGLMDSLGWHYYPNCDALRDLFWQTFELASGGLSAKEKRVIQIARMAGLFLQYVFSSANGSQAPVKKGSTFFRHLNAFCAAEN